MTGYFYYFKPVLINERAQRGIAPEKFNFRKNLKMGPKVKIDPLSIFW
jgi:hypothetical protein